MVKRIDIAKQTNTANFDSAARLPDDFIRLNLSGQLETLQRLQPGHIAIMVQCSLVWRQIQSLRIAYCPVNLVKWAYCHLDSVRENGRDK